MQPQTPTPAPAQTINYEAFNTSRKIVTIRSLVGAIIIVAGLAGMAESILHSSTFNNSSIVNFLFVGCTSVVIVGVYIIVAPWLINHEKVIDQFISDNNLEERVEDMPTVLPKALAVLGLGSDGAVVTAYKGMNQYGAFEFASLISHLHGSDNQGMRANAVIVANLPKAYPYALFINQIDMHRFLEPQSLFGTTELTLEGGFNEHFSVHINKDTAQDVLTYVTPDFMQALLAVGQLGTNIEINGSKVYIWKFEVKLDGTTIRALLQTLDVVQQYID